jgi:hypothetical protein
MIKVKNKYIPFSGYSAMAIYPFLFHKAKLSQRTLNHERIHFAQQKECLIVFFYLLYLLMWLRYGYRNIPFEREAYDNAHFKDYLTTRRRFAWLKYI